MYTLNINGAFNFYKRFILDYSHDKADIYKKYGFSLQGSIGFKDWEVFAAILLNDQAKPGNGTDLMNYEVKSALLGNSFEYQYHKNHGVQKLQEDKLVHHVFIGRSTSYLDVSVWMIENHKLTPIFDNWLPELKENYETGIRQRFRRSINFNYVKREGELLLEIKHGQCSYP